MQIKEESIKDLKLSPEERQTLDRMKSFEQLDKGSQNRLRAKINQMRKVNPDFEEAFEISLSSALIHAKQPRKESLLGSVAEIVTHPITALKGKVASTMLKKRNTSPGIRIYPDPVLKQVAEPWDFEKGDKKELIEIVRKLGATLRDVSYGQKLGMAAPQIGISKRVFVCQGAVCVNPEWQVPSHDVKEETLEGCYSVPEKRYITKRSKYGWASWYSVDGTRREFKLKGLDAIVFQHELDHLDGKCCIDIGVEVKDEKKA